MKQHKSKYYTAYQDAKSRCNNPNNKSYPLYGGRGIKFLFNSYQEFELSLGEKPVGYTLDRIDTNGHYEFNNVRWASRQMQNQNRRKHIQHKVHKDSITKHLGISFDKKRNKFIVRKHSKFLGRTNTLKEAILLYDNPLSNS